MARGETAATRVVASSHRPCLQPTLL